LVRDASTVDTAEADAAPGAVGESHIVVVRAIGPAQRAGPAIARTMRELAGAAVDAPPAQSTRLGGRDVQRAAIGESIGAHMAVDGGLRTAYQCGEKGADHKKLRWLYRGSS
jgi:hypothetical protein